MAGRQSSEKGRSTRVSREEEKVVAAAKMEFEEGREQAR